MVEKKFLTVPQAAMFLGRSPRAVWHLIYLNKIPHRRLGSRVIIPADELEEFIKALPGVRVGEALETVFREKEG